MASSLDLQEQEQLDQLKAFWNRWGNLLTWALTLVLAALAAYNGWNWWQREQAAKAAALHAELERAAQAGEVDRVVTAWSDLKARHPSTVQAQQGALIAARIWVEKDRPDDARTALQWLAESAGDPAYRIVARLRWAGILLDQDKAQEALTVLDAARGGGFDALVEDRRADALVALSQADAAREALKAAYKAMPEDLEYRRVVEAKLMAQGVDPASLKAGANPQAEGKGDKGDKDANDVKKKDPA